MIEFENIKKHQREIQELKSKSEAILKEVAEGFKSKYGFPMPNTSLQSLGIDEIFRIYSDKIRQQKKNIENEYIKLFSSIANSIAKENIKPPLIDYTIPFRFIENSASRAICRTEQGKLLYYFLTKPVNNFREFQSKLLTEPGFFNQADVIFEKGKAPYQSTIKNTKYSLQNFNILDKKGNITALGKGVRELFLKEIDDYGELADSISEESFESLIAYFIRSNDLENNLIRLDGKENLEVNFKYIKDTSDKIAG